jgi:hypothetical protein
MPGQENHSSPPDEDGFEELTVTWGREHVQAVQFCGFDVGPFSLTVRLRDGESVESAYERAQARLSKVAEVEFSRKLREHLDRVRRAAQAGR